MGANSKTTYGADGSTSLLSFYPEKLTLVIDPNHPLYDERINLPLDEMMIRNIQSFGVLEPIIVTRDPETGDVLVIDGRQRVRHAMEANRRLDAAGLPMLLVPATTRKGDNAATLFGVMVATNELRQADPPLIRAAKMQRMKNLGQDDEAVALAFGLNVLTVRNTLVLLDCGKVAQKAIQEGYIGVTDALYLSRLTPAQQTAKVEEIIRATAGKMGHAKVKAKREVLSTTAPGTKPAAPKMKGRKEIRARQEEYEALEAVDRNGYSEGFREALAWVLGSVPDEAPPVDTKTLPMFEGA